MRILGVLKKPRFVGQVFNLNNTSAIFSDNTGRHSVSTGAGVTSVGGKASFAVGNMGVIASGGDPDAIKDFDMTKMGDFDVSFKFQMTADPDTLSLLFAFGDSSGNTGAGIFCYIGVLGGALRVVLSAGGLPSSLRHPTTQVVGAAEQTVLVTRRGLLYTITVDGVSVSGTASSMGFSQIPCNLIIGGWPAQSFLWDLVGTIRDFVVTKV
jgi:hypothetical protein